MVWNETMTMMQNSLKWSLLAQRIWLCSKCIFRNNSLAMHIWISEQGSMSYVRWLVVVMFPLQWSNQQLHKRNIKEKKKAAEKKRCSFAFVGSSTPISALLSSLGSRIRQTSRKICTTYIFTHRPDRIRSILQRETSRVIEEEDKRLFTLLLGTHKVVKNYKN